MDGRGGENRTPDLLLPKQVAVAIGNVRAASAVNLTTSSLTESPMLFGQWRLHRLMLASRQNDVEPGQKQHQRLRRR